MRHFIFNKMLTSRVALLLIFILILSSITSITSDNATTEEVTTEEVTTTVYQNSTEPEKPTDAPVPLWEGFLGCIIASLFFGSNFIPVKQFSAGDGFFYQFIFCVVVWFVGLILDLILNNQRFYPLVLVGGILWTTGNLATVFCIKTCGLSVGLLIWGTTSLIVGWAGGRFGFFNIHPQVPSSSSKLALNYVSVLFAAASGIFFLFIKSTTTPKKVLYGAQYDDTPEVELAKMQNINLVDGNDLDTDFPFLNQLSEKAQKRLGCALAALAGVFYGLQFIPDQYIRDHAENYLHNGERPPKNGLYYINSQYSGILLSSLFYFIIYAALKRNKPSINPSICLPAMVSGAMWAIANIGFILAISALKSAVAFPIVSVLPGVVSSLWSLFLFREIQGRNNYIFLGIGMIVRILAAVFSGLSA